MNNQLSSSIFSSGIKRSRLVAAATSAVTASMILTGYVSADTTYVWNGSTSTTGSGGAVTYNFNTPANWNLGVGGAVATTFPKTNTSIAEFTGAVANDVNYNVTSAANQTIDQLNFTGVTSAFNIKGVNPLSLFASASALGSAGATNVGLYQDATSTAVSSITTTPLVLASNQTWEIDGAGVSVGTATAGGISGAFTLNKTGSGTLTINNSNVTTGAITVSAGELELTGTATHPNTSSFGSPITVGGTTTAALLILGGAGTTLNSEVDLSNTVAGGTYTLGDNADSSTVNYGGTINLGHAATFSAHAAKTVVNVTGQLTGAKGIVKIGPGTLNLTNTTNNYTGVNSTVSNGELRANNGFTSPDVANGSATGTSTVGIGGGTFGGNGGVSGNVNLTAGNITAGADDNTPGQLIIGKTLAVTLAPGNAYNWKINDAIGTKGATDGWDDVSANAITFTTPASPATAGPFTINLQSLSSGAPGALSSAPTSPTTWTIAESTSGSIVINGVSYSDTESLTGPGTAPALVGLFALNSSGFTLPGGVVPSADQLSLGLANVGGSEDLQLTYNAVPEPTSLAVLGIAGLGLLRRRGRA